MNNQDLEILLKSILHAMQDPDEAGKWRKIDEACAKAAVGDLNKLMPTEVSAVYDPSKGPRAVIRAGQREIPGAGTMPPVDLQFQHLVKATDDRE